MRGEDRGDQGAHRLRVRHDGGVATLGGIVGSSLTATLASHVEPTHLLLASAALLEVAVFSVRHLSRLSEALRLRRAGNFAVARPTREVLFTVIPREDKYKAKSFIDTVVYRAGDQIGARSYGLLSFLGLGMTGIAIAAIPISAAWVLNSVWLGRRQEVMATAQVSP